jgi:hypothetical protein
MIWTQGSILGRHGGTLTSWVTQAPIIGQIRISFHDGCCKDVPQRRYLLECRNLGIADFPLKVKSLPGAKKSAIKVVRACLLEAHESLEP